MAKAKNVTVENTGLCAIFILRERVMPGDEFEVPAEMLETDAFEYLIAKGELRVKDDSAANKEIKERADKKRKKDPNEGKTLTQLEDGGEF